MAISFSCIILSLGSGCFTTRLYVIAGTEMKQAALKVLASRQMLTCDGYNMEQASIFPYNLKKTFKPNNNLPLILYTLLYWCISQLLYLHLYLLLSNLLPSNVMSTVHTMLLLNTDIVHCNLVYLSEWKTNQVKIVELRHWKSYIV